MIFHVVCCGPMVTCGPSAVASSALYVRYACAYTAGRIRYASSIAWYSIAHCARARSAAHQEEAATHVLGDAALVRARADDLVRRDPAVPERGREVVVARVEDHVRAVDERALPRLGGCG
jgi:hypothetical protein